MDKLDRREFLRLGAGIAGNAALSNIRASQSVSVADFGADRTGHRDSTGSIANAISHLVSNGGQTLFLPLGTYRLASAQQAAISFSNHANFEIDGGGSTILMGNDALCLAFDRCANVQVRNLTIDWDPLPYTQGTISDSGIGWFEVKLDDGFPPISANGIMAIESYDRSLRNIARNGVQVSGDKVTAVQPLSINRVRIRSSHVIPITIGTVIVIRFKGNHDAIRLTQCQSISFSGTTLLSSHSMGYNISSSSNLTFRQCTIGFQPTGQRLLSTNADGMHITNCGGSLTIDQCMFAGMGDDAINVNAAMWRVRSRLSGSGAMLLNRSGMPLSQNDTPGPQDKLEVLDPADLHVIKRDFPNGLATVPDNSLVDDLARVPVTTINRCHFLGNHSRAILGHSHLQVRNCVFQNTSLAAIMIAPDDHWMEGPTTGDIVIDGNTFAGCHYATHDPEGTITVDIEQTYGRRGAVPRGIAQIVQISDNIFKDCYTGAVSCRSVDGLTIRGNQVDRTWIGGSNQAAIEASELRNSDISNNISTAANTIVVRDSESTRISDNRGFS
jgi:hypothetical protein